MANITTMDEYALDIDVALSHVDGDSEFLSELAGMFVQDYPRLIEESRDGILQANCAVVERAAHTLKGRLAFFGITRLRDKLMSLESMGREHDLSRAPQLLADIETAMKSILLEFEALTREQGR
jgi:two-component system, sensor histidine kinase and response regulator